MPARRLRQRGPRFAPAVRRWVGGPDVPDTEPRVFVQAAFGSAPGDALASMSWTTLTNKVASVSTGRGRSSELSAFTAGTATVVLLDDARTFDPQNAAGPYFGLLVPLVPLRVVAVFDGTDYPLFTGFVTGWPQQYLPGDGMSRVTLTCVDGFEVLRQADWPSSVFELEQLADDPHALYPLSDGAGAVSAVDRAGVFDGEYAGTVGSAAALAYGGESGTEFTAGDEVVLPAGVTPLWELAGPAAAVTVEALIRTDDATASDRYIWWQSAAFGPFGRAFVLLLNSSHQPVFETVVDGITSDVALAAVAVNDGEVHHLVGRIERSGFVNTIRLFVDGVEYSGSAILGRPIVGPNVKIAAPFSATTLGFPGDIASLALYNDSLSDARIDDHYAAIAAPWDGDTTGERAGRLLDAAGWPTADRNLDAGITILGPATLGGNALADIQAVERTEQARFFCGGDGRAWFLDRHAAILDATASTSQATFGDDPAAGELPIFHDGYQPRYDRDDIKNVVTASRVDGPDVTVRDDTSIGQYLRRSDEVTGLLFETDNEVRALAEYRLDRYKDPLHRLEQITVKPYSPQSGTWTVTELWEAVLGAEIGKRYTVKRRPLGVGDPIELAALCEGVTHTFTPGNNWTTTLRLSPADTSPYWVLGTSELGTDTRLAF